MPRDLSRGSPRMVCLTWQFSLQYVLSWVAQSDWFHEFQHAGPVFFPCVFKREQQWWESVQVGSAFIRLLHEANFLLAGLLACVSIKLSQLSLVCLNSFLLSAAVGGLIK